MLTIRRVDASVKHQRHPGAARRKPRNIRNGGGGEKQGREGRGVDIEGATKPVNSHIFQSPQNLPLFI